MRELLVILVVLIVSGLVLYWTQWKTTYSDGSPAIWYYNVDGDYTRLPENLSKTPYGNIYNDFGIEPAK